MNSFPHFILLVDKVFFFLLCPEMERASFITNATYAETLGSYRKVNSYYDYYVYSKHHIYQFTRWKWNFNDA